VSDDRGETISAFRAVPRTGVIYVTTEAMRAGYHPGDERWCNLGQGQPETGPLPRAPPPPPPRAGGPDEPRGGEPGRGPVSGCPCPRLHQRSSPGWYPALIASVVT